MSHKTRKKTKLRIMPLTEHAFTVISHYYSLQDKLDYSKLSIQIIVRRVSQRAGIAKKVSPTFSATHSLSHALNAESGTRSLQQFFGHDRLTTTEIYPNMSPEGACREFMWQFQIFLRQYIEIVAFLFYISIMRLNFCIYFRIIVLNYIEL